MNLFRKLVRKDSQNLFISNWTKRDLVFNWIETEKGCSFFSLFFLFWFSLFSPYYFPYFPLIIFSIFSSFSYLFNGSSSLNIKRTERDKYKFCPLYCTKFRKCKLYNIIICYLHWIKTPRLWFISSKRK